MLTKLRTPSIFALLTIVLVGWMSSFKINQYPYAWVYESKPWASRRLYRPFYQLANGRSPFNTRDLSRMTSSHGLRTAPRHIAIRSPSGLAVVRTEVLANDDFRKTIDAAGFIEIRIRLDEFGILAPVLFRQTNAPHVFPYAGVPTLTVEEACEAFSALDENQPPLYNPTPRVKWNVWYRSVFHDTLFLLTLVSWLVSLAAIPKWPLWRRLTPAQRRRARGCCPHCNYNLEGLASPTCPECGNQVGSVPVS